MRTHVAVRIVAAFFGASLLAGCAGSASRKPVPAPVPAGESEAQERFLRAVIGAEPQHWRARIRLANLASASGRPGEAFEVLSEAARQSPRNVALQTAMGGVAEQSDYLDWCLYSWLKAMRESPGDVSVRLKLASLYRRVGWQRDAAAQLAVAAALDPYAQPVLLEQAAFYVRQGQPDDIRRCANQLIARYPKSPYGYSLLADMAARAGRWKEAVESGARALERAPGDPTFEVRQAKYLLTRTDSPQPEAALTLLEAAGADSQDPEIPYWRGVALRRLSRTQEAIRQIELAYARAPSLPGVALQLSELYRAEGKTAEASRLLDAHAVAERRYQSTQTAATALAVDPRAVKNHLNMAKAHLEAGAAAEALVEFLTVRRMQPENPEVKSGIQTALTQQGRALGSVAPL